jgi:hypothetical protein
MGYDDERSHLDSDSGIAGDEAHDSGWDDECDDGPDPTGTSPE